MGHQTLLYKVSASNSQRKLSKVIAEIGASASLFLSSFLNTTPSSTRPYDFKIQQILVESSSIHFNISKLLTSSSSTSFCKFLHCRMLNFTKGGFLPLISLAFPLSISVPFPHQYLFPFPDPLVPQHLYLVFYLYQITPQLPRAY